MTRYESSSRRIACVATRQLRYPTDARGRVLPSSAARHEASCLGCQADAIRHRQVMSGLVDMQGVIESMPYDLAAALDSGKVAIPSFGTDELAVRRWRSRTAIASAASLAAIGVAVAATRRFRSAS